MKLDMVTEADYEMAKKALDFIQETLGNKENLNEFEYNLLVMSRQKAVRSRQSGLAAYILPYFHREGERLAREKATAEKSPSKHFGAVGEKVVFFAQLTGIFPVESMYGTTFITKMVSREGNAITWFASYSVEGRGEMEQGKEYMIKATVKKHDNYKGIEQTVVTRATIFTDEGRAEYEAKEERKAARAAKKAAKAAKVAP